MLKNITLLIIITHFNNIHYKYKETKWVIIMDE